MKEIEKLHNLYLLKEVERKNRVKERNESSAEHTYSCQILAQFFLPKINKKLDELKVMKMLLYHDIVEIEAGDTFDLIKNEENSKAKIDKEKKAFEVLKEKIPSIIAKEIEVLWIEYEEGKTVEAKFSRAINQLDPIIQSLFKKQDWKDCGFSEDIHRNNKEKYFKDFPEIMDVFNKLVKHCKENDYYIE